MGTCVDLASHLLKGGGGVILHGRAVGMTALTTVDDEPVPIAKEGRSSSFG